MLILNALEYLENTAARLPDKLSFADEKRGYTFAELNSSARAVGTYLCENNVGIRERVAVLVDRTAITLVGFFGALEAGCAYVPVDVKMPQDRMNDILSEVKPAAILYAEKDSKIADGISSFAPTVCIEEAEKTEINDTVLAGRREKVLDIDPAYMIFTSGSTGKPKGILISHRSLIDFTEWMAEFCGITEENTMGNQAPFYFDLSVKDISDAQKRRDDIYPPEKSFPVPDVARRLYKRSRCKYAYLGDVCVPSCRGFRCI